MIWYFALRHTTSLTLLWSEKLNVKVKPKEAYHLLWKKQNKINAGMSVPRFCNISLPPYQLFSTQTDEARKKRKKGGKERKLAQKLQNISKDYGKRCYMRTKREG